MSNPSNYQSLYAKLLRTFQHNLPPNLNLSQSKMSKPTVRSAKVSDMLDAMSVSIGRDMHLAAIEMLAGFKRHEEEMIQSLLAPPRGMFARSGWVPEEQPAQIGATVKLRVPALWPVNFDWLSGPFDQSFHSSPSPAHKAPPAIDPAKLAALKNAAPRKVGQRVPDQVAVITGWRAWCANQKGGELRLEALGQDTIWEPKKAMAARCTKSSGHCAPEKKCGCGFWAFSDLDKLTAALQDDYENVRILGKVSLWGRVIECTNGYRAQYAYPAELWLLNPEHEQLGYIYGVPVRTA